MVWNFAVLDSLVFWNDMVVREGPENMAVDELLWLQSTVAVLRVYRWHGDWTSLGYFSRSAAVSNASQIVRRPTGGGIVDHRHDWTYTLVIPRGNAWAEMPGAESYGVIHQALALVLQQEGNAVRMATAEASGDATHCFAHPVTHDLIDSKGGKIAGAGQRRGLTGLLHQGSVALPIDDSEGRGMRLLHALAREHVKADLAPDADKIAELAQGKYRKLDWTFRR